MHPDITLALAQAHRDDLYRAAARHRRLRLATTDRSARTGAAARWRASIFDRLTALRGAASGTTREPTCCPA